MKKILILFFMTIAFDVNAEFLDFSKFVNDQKLSDDFLQKLEKCIPYSETKKLEMNDLENLLVYEITGKKNVGDDESDLMCELKISSQSSNNVSSSSICYFDDYDLQEYVKAMRKYNERTSYTMENLSEVLTDENYIIASSLVMANCEAVREEIDNTKNIRKNLVSCTPYEETEKQGYLEFTRKIIGANNNNCNFQYTVLKKIPDLKNIGGELADKMKKIMQEYPISEIAYTYNCSFSEDKKQEYIKILEKLVIPAGDAMDFSFMETIDPKLEMNFLIDNCKVVITEK